MGAGQSQPVDNVWGTGSQWPSPPPSQDQLWASASLADVFEDDNDLAKEKVGSGDTSQHQHQHQQGKQIEPRCSPSQSAAASLSSIYSSLDDLPERDAFWTLMSKRLHTLHSVHSAMTRVARPCSSSLPWQASDSICTVPVTSERNLSDVCVELLSSVLDQALATGHGMQQGQGSKAMLGDVAASLGAAASLAPLSLSEGGPRDVPSEVMQNLRAYLRRAWMADICGQDDCDQRLQAMGALVSLARARGRASDLLLVTHCLLAECTEYSTPREVGAESAEERAPAARVVDKLALKLKAVSQPQAAPAVLIMSHRKDDPVINPAEATLPPHLQLQEDDILWGDDDSAMIVASADDNADIVSCTDEIAFVQPTSPTAKDVTESYYPSRGVKVRKGGGGSLTSRNTRDFRRHQDVVELAAPLLRQLRSAASDGGQRPPSAAAACASERAAMFILGSMDRLSDLSHTQKMRARHHRNYAVDLTSETFQLLLLLLQHLAGPDTAPHRVLPLISCLHILQANLSELLKVIQEASQTDAAALINRIFGEVEAALGTWPLGGKFPLTSCKTEGDLPPSLLRELRQELVRLVGHPPEFGPECDESSWEIQAEASRTLVVGLEIFYPSSSERITLLKNLLQMKAATSADDSSSRGAVAERRFLLNPVLSCLASDHLAAQLVPNPEQSCSTQEEEAALSSMIELVQLLLSSAHSSGVAENPQDGPSAKASSAGVSLLLALQKHLLHRAATAIGSGQELGGASPLVVRCLIKYTHLVLGVCSAKVEESCNPGSLVGLLDSCPITPLLPSLVTGLLSFTCEQSVCEHLLEPVCKIFGSLRATAEKVPGAVCSDVEFVANRESMRCVKMMPRDLILTKSAAVLAGQLAVRLICGGSDAAMVSDSSQRQHREWLSSELLMGDPGDLNATRDSHEVFEPCTRALLLASWLRALHARVDATYAAITHQAECGEDGIRLNVCESGILKGLLQRCGLWKAAVRYHEASSTLREGTCVSECRAPPSWLAAVWARVAMITLRLWQVRAQVKASDQLAAVEVLFRRTRQFAALLGTGLSSIESKFALFPASTSRRWRHALSMVIAVCRLKRGAMRPNELVLRSAVLLYNETLGEVLSGVVDSTARRNKEGLLIAIAQQARNDAHMAVTRSRGLDALRSILLDAHPFPSLRADILYSLASVFISPRGLDRRYLQHLDAVPVKLRRQVTTSFEAFLEVLLVELTNREPVLDARTSQIIAQLWGLNLMGREDVLMMNRLNVLSRLRGAISSGPLKGSARQAIPERHAWAVFKILVLQLGKACGTLSDTGEAFPARRLLESVRSVFEVLVCRVWKASNSRRGQELAYSSIGDACDPSSGNCEGPHHRRRCQELILYPRHFKYTEEGVGFPVDQLLNVPRCGDFSISFWLRLEQDCTGLHRCLLARGDRGDSWPVILLRDRDLCIEVCCGVSSMGGTLCERLTSKQPLQLHVWTHVCLVSEGMKLRLYMNGALDSQRNVAGVPRSPCHPLHVGSIPVGSTLRLEGVKGGFEGSIAQLRHYTRALSPIHVRIICDPGPPEVGRGRHSIRLCEVLSCLETAARASQSLRKCLTEISWLNLLASAFMEGGERTQKSALRLLRIVLPSVHPEGLPCGGKIMLHNMLQLIGIGSLREVADVETWAGTPHNVTSTQIAGRGHMLLSECGSIHAMLPSNTFTEVYKMCIESAPASPLAAVNDAHEDNIPNENETPAPEGSVPLMKNMPVSECDAGGDGTDIARACTALLPIGEDAVRGMAEIAAELVELFRDLGRSGVNWKVLVSSVLNEALKSEDERAAMVGAMQVLGSHVEFMREGLRVSIDSQDAIIAGVDDDRQGLTLQLEGDSFSGDARLLRVSIPSEELVISPSMPFLFEGALDAIVQTVACRSLLSPACGSLVVSHSLQSMVAGVLYALSKSEAGVASLVLNKELLRGLLEWATRCDRSTTFKTLQNAEERAILLRRRLTQLNDSDAVGQKEEGHLPSLMQGGAVSCPFCFEHDLDRSRVAQHIMECSARDARRMACPICLADAADLSLHDLPAHFDLIHFELGDGVDGQWPSLRAPHFPMEVSSDEPTPDLVQQLQVIGFPVEWCKMALKQNGNDVVEASTWIVDHLDLLGSVHAGELVDAGQDMQGDGEWGGASSEPSLLSISMTQGDGSSLPAIQPSQDDYFDHESGASSFAESYFPAPQLHSSRMLSNSAALLQEICSLSKCQLRLSAAQTEAALAVLYCRGTVLNVLAAMPGQVSVPDLGGADKIVSLTRVLCTRGSQFVPNQDISQDDCWGTALVGLLETEATARTDQVHATLSSALLNLALGDLEDAASTGALREIAWGSRPLWLPDNHSLRDPSVERAKWLISLLLRTPCTHPALFSEFTMSRAVRCLRSANLPVKAVSARLVAAIAHRWRQQLSDCLGGECHVPSPLAMEETLQCQGHLTLQRIRCALARRAASERRQGRIIFSEYTRSLADLYVSIDSLLVALAATRSKRSSRGDITQPPLSTPLPPELLYAAETCVALTWGRRCGGDPHSVIYEVQVAPPCIGDDESGTSLPQADCRYRVAYRGRRLRCKAEGLTPGHCYSFRLRACAGDGGNGTSPWSDVAHFRTLPGPSFIFSQDTPADVSGAFISSDGATVSYASDERWYTVIGSSGFIRGRNRWQIRIDKSPSAYIFVGVARREADVNTFLGGDAHGWGYIGDRALYHQRLKVRPYGQRFGAGDTIGVILDLDMGTLSFTHNGVSLGVAVEGLAGEFFPAVSFYNSGQRISLVAEAFHCPGSGVVVSGAPDSAVPEDLSSLRVILRCLVNKQPLPTEFMRMAALAHVAWLRGEAAWCITLAGYSLLFDGSSTSCALLGCNSGCGARIRTPRGPATIVGVWDNALWCCVDGERGAWFFTKEQVVEGSAAGLFQSISSTTTRVHSTEEESMWSRKHDDDSVAQFTSLAGWVGWTPELDAWVVTVLDECTKSGLEPWNVSPQHFMDVMSSYAGRMSTPQPRPAPEAVLARLSLLRMLDMKLCRVLPLLDAPAGDQTANSAGEEIANLVANFRACIFLSTKLSALEALLVRTKTQPQKAEDEYDYPDNLPQISLNRSKAASASGDFSRTLYGQLRNQLRGVEHSLLRLGYTHPMDDGQQRAFKVKFEGEGVDDYGGPYREMFTQLAAELRCGSVPEALIPPTRGDTSADMDEEFVLRPRPRGLSLSALHFMGQLLGIALRSSVTAAWPLPRSLWKQLANQPLSRADLAPAAIYKLEQLMRIPESTLGEEGGGLSWAVDLCEETKVELRKGGKDMPVRPTEMVHFVHAYIKAHLQESASSTSVVMSGLQTVIPVHLLHLFTWQQLQLQFCGTPGVDIDRLEANTEYDEEVLSTDAHVRSFWRVLRSWGEADRSQFLRFVWARSRLPAGSGELSQKFKIQAANAEAIAATDKSKKYGRDADGGVDSMLPLSHTCFFSINLPRYSSDKTMEERLRYAMYNCVEMDADFRIADGDATSWVL